MQVRFLGPPGRGITTTPGSGLDNAVRFGMRYTLFSLFLCLACEGTIADTPSDDPPVTLNPGVEPLEPAVRDLGRAPLRRLTRTEYTNSIAEIFALEGNFTRSFGEDERVGPFSSNTVAPPQEFELRNYDSAAIEIAELAAPKIADYVASCDVENDACADAYIEWLAVRTYRKAVTPEDLSALKVVFELGAEDSFESGVRLVTRAALNSPYFLYIFDWAAMSAEELKPLDAYSLASRLSFFLWKSAPDQELLDAAADASLLEDEVLRAQATRLLADDRASDMISEFFLNWLHIEDLDEHTKDRELFADYTEETALALLSETSRFVQYVIQEGDGQMETLFTAPFSFPSDELSTVYGPMEPAGGDLPDDARVFGENQRRGLLTHGSFLARHAHASQTSPIHRGVIIRENVLCQPLNDPPNDVIDEPPPPNPEQTTRERFAAVTANPRCGSCHARIDGIGFGFEAYDAIGRFNETENGLDIDDTGELVGTREIDGEFEGVIELSERLAGSNIVRGCLLQQLVTYALGRFPALEDRWQLEQLYAAFEASDFNVRELLIEIAVSDAMRHIKTEVSP